jgi:hypothetical protein
MIRSLFLVILTCACLQLHAQVNCVKNGSLEDYHQCPNDYEQIRLAKYWSQIDTIDYNPLCSPEYCNACAGANIYCGVPKTFYFNQYPRSGNGMAQLEMYFDNAAVHGSYQRDYLQGRLSKSLVSGRTYCVTFYVTLEECSQYAINHIGAYLDDGSIDNIDSINCALPQTSYTPQVFETSIINDTINWVKVQGSFVALGSEQFITIGNFFDVTNTDTVRVPSGSSLNYSYYLVDDVSVIESNAIADAGADGLVSPGSDSVYIGTHEQGLPYTWYIVGNSTPIGYSGGFKVHPSTTTSYAVELDLCGSITRDTVVVYAAPVGSAAPFRNGLTVFPNPAHDDLTIENAQGYEVIIQNVVGQQVHKISVLSDKERIGVKNLPSGVYIVSFIKSDCERKTIKVVKE